MQRELGKLTIIEVSDAMCGKILEIDCQGNEKKEDKRVRVGTFGLLGGSYYVRSKKGRAEASIWTSWKKVRM